MLTLLDRAIGDRRLVAVATQRSDGDVHPERVEATVLGERQCGSTGAEWSMLHQVHGIDVVEAVRPPGGGPGRRASPIVGVGDVQYTDATDVHLAMWAADCATVFMWSQAGRLVAAHAGWRGLASGVLDVAVETLVPSSVEVAVLGPTIHPCCYEFGAHDRRLVELGVGAEFGELESTTSWGTPALDVPRAVSTALAAHGIGLDVSGPCTGCSDDWFSHRIRAEPGRHATIGWMEELGPQHPARPQHPGRLEALGG